MHFLHPSNLWHHLSRWLREHRPLAWVERSCTVSLEKWRPDPPVMDRLIR